MTTVNVTELRQHLPDYLKQVQRGEEIAIMLHGKTIARIIPEHAGSKRETASKRLETLRGSVIVGDIMAPIEDEWTGDADHL